MSLLNRYKLNRLEYVRGRGVTVEKEKRIKGSRALGRFWLERRAYVAYEVERKLVGCGIGMPWPSLAGDLVTKKMLE